MSFRWTCPSEVNEDEIRFESGSFGIGYANLAEIEDTCRSIFPVDDENDIRTIRTANGLDIVLLDCPWMIGAFFQSGDAMKALYFDQFGEGDEDLIYRIINSMMFAGVPTPTPPPACTVEQRVQIKDSGVYMILPAGARNNREDYWEYPSNVSGRILSVTNGGSPNSKWENLTDVEAGYRKMYAGISSYSVTRVKSVHGVDIVLVKHPMRVTATFESTKGIYEVEFDIHDEVDDALVSRIVRTLQREGGAEAPPAPDAGDVVTARISDTDVYVNLPAGSNVENPKYGNSWELPSGKVVFYGPSKSYSSMAEAENYYKTEGAADYSISRQTVNGIEILMSERWYADETQSLISVYFESAGTLYQFNCSMMNWEQEADMIRIIRSMHRRVEVTPTPVPTPTPTPVPIPDPTPVTVKVNTSNVTVDLPPLSITDDPDRPDGWILPGRVFLFHKEDREYESLDAVEQFYIDRGAEKQISRQIINGVDVILHVKGSSANGPVYIGAHFESRGKLYYFGFSGSQYMTSPGREYFQEIVKTFRTRIPGDANEDGRADMLDALLILDYAAGIEVTINQTNAEVDGNGKVDISDALLILQYDAAWDIELK